MSTTIVENETQLAAWDGVSNLQINASFSITTDTSSYFPLNITASSDITIQSNPSASEIYVITIDTSPSTDWSGLFSITTTNTVSISNLSFNCVSASLIEYNSLILRGPANNGVNPNVSFSQCGIVVGSDITKITYSGKKWAGFVGNLETQQIGSVISFTNCTYQGYTSGGSGCLVAQGYIGGDILYSCTITVTNCFVEIIQPTGYSITENNPSGIMGSQVEKHNVTVSDTIVNLNNLSTFDSDTAFGGFFGNAAGGFTVSNSYVIVTSTSGVCNISFTSTDIYTAYACTVTNCYFVNQASATNTFTFSNLGGDGCNLTLTNCAFQNDTTANTVNDASSNNIYTYTYTTDTASEPFTSWSGSFWSNLNTTTPPILSAFTITPFIDYTTAISIPVLSLSSSVPCLCRGMKILTPSGDVPIESLKEGDLLLAPPINKRTVKIQRIYSSTYMGTRENVPYRIPAHFFEKNIPNEDVLLSPNHLVFYNGKWHLPCQMDGLYPEEHMIGKWFEYYHIRLPDYYSDKVWCHNLPVDSWDYQETTTLDILEQEACNAASITSLSSLSPCGEKSSYSNNISIIH